MGLSIITADRKKLPIIGYEQFIKIHKSQLALIPKIYWASLYEKISCNIFDLNKNIEIETKQITYARQVKKQMTARVCNRNGIRQDDPSSVFLIQHLAHYYASEGRELMKELVASRSPILGYLKKLMNIHETNVCAFINSLLEESWRYVIPFSIKGRGNKKSLPIWSITEQVGMVIKHSCNPNFRMVTFQYLNLKRIYSVIFPIVAVVNYRDEVTRDYNFFEKFDFDQIKLNALMQQEHLDFRGLTNSPSRLSGFNLRLSIDQSAVQWTVEDEMELLKKTLLIPWQPDNLRIYTELEINYQQNEPTVIEFFEKRGFAELYSMLRCEPKGLKSAVAAKSLVKVYCDDKQVMRYLTDSRFVFVNDKGLADIWWLKDPFFQFAEMYREHPATLVNHFPLGHLLDDKSAMPAMVRRKLACFNGNFNPYNLTCHPQFLPASFDLNRELVKFVSYFTRRQLKNLDNYWIIKPTNSKSSMDVFITNNLNAIIRLRSTQSRVAQSYIAKPLLFHRPDTRKLVKFELKYFVVVTSVLPLKLFVYRGFQVDLANEAYEHPYDHLYNQEMHLTDMSIFSGEVERLDMSHIEFIRYFDSQFKYLNFDFDKVDSQTMSAIRVLFELSTEKFPFAAISHNTGSSALYQVDVLLSWVEQSQYGPALPVQSNIIECNLNPNCAVICRSFPSFYNELFELMFFDKEDGNFRAI